MSADENRQTIEAFYAAFAECDGDGMAACYAPDVRFGDPVFPDLRGDEAGDMWRMLTGTPGTDLHVELREHGADDRSGTAHWIARYRFSQTGRAVVNDVNATFRFAPDGRIAEHHDRFGLYRWTRQALGTPGLLLGWTPIVQGPVRRRAAAALQEFRRAR